VLQGVRTAIEVAGPALRAVRLDSGDLADQARQVRLLLDSLGASHTRIVATSDLDEHRIAALADDPVDEYGVGTALVTGSGAPTANLVYKLVAIAGEDGTMRPVAKRSAGKRTLGGRKWAYRDSTGEVLLSRPAERPGLQVPLVDDLPAARTRCAAALAALPAEARALSPGQPAWTAVLP
jgi:nicotinate phosphoribosyltransferase